VGGGFGGWGGGGGMGWVVCVKKGGKRSSKKRKGGINQRRNRSLSKYYPTGGEKVSEEWEKKKGDFLVQKARHLDPHVRNHFFNTESRKGVTRGGGGLSRGD